MDRRISSELRPLTTLSFLLFMGFFINPAHAAAPANDNFANATTLSGSSGQIPADTNVEATRESGEPFVTDAVQLPTNASVWYKWTVPANGAATINTFGSNFDTVLAVYTGTSVSALSEVIHNDDFNGTTSQVIFSATSGTTYYISVQGYSFAAGTLTLTYSLDTNGGGGGPGAPINDNFADATPLFGSGQRLNDTNNNATSEPTEVSPFGTPGVPGKTVWYRWTPNDTGTGTGPDVNVTVDTLGSNFDTRVAVYNSSLGTSAIASNDDAGGGVNQSSVPFMAADGVEYFIQVDGFNNTSGTIVLNHSIRNNNNFINALVLSGDSGTVTSSTVGADREMPDEPTPAGAFGLTASVWFAWTPTTSGTKTISTFGSDFDTVLGVYTGTALNNLQEVNFPTPNGGSNDNVSFMNLQSKVNFDATMGTTYYIVVDGAFFSTGNVTLNYGPIVRPANDNFANATNLTGTSGFRDNDTLVDSTREMGEPFHPEGMMSTASVWYKWTVPFTGTARVTVPFELFPQLVAVYSANNPGAPTVDMLTLIGNTSQPMFQGPPPPPGDEFEPPDLSSLSRVNFEAVAGTTYYIAVSAQFETGTFSLNYGKAGAPANDNFADAFILQNTSGSRLSDTNEDATDEVGEPDHAQLPGGRSVWYQWTVPVTGQIQIDTFGSNFDTLLAVYTGNSVSALTEVASNDQTDGNQSRVTIDVTAGTVLHIAVDGFFGFSGRVVLNYRVQIPWKQTGSLSMARDRAAAVALDDDDKSVFVTGGSLNNVALDSAEIYNPKTGLWKQATRMSDARMQHTASRLTTQNGPETQTNVLVAGGRRRGTVTNTSEIYNTENKSWSPTFTPLNVARANHTATELSGPQSNVFVAGGENASGAPLKDCETYDGFGWMTKAMMSAARTGHTATLLNDGTVLVTGGQSDTGIVATIEIFDPMGGPTGSWTSKASMANARRGHTATRIDTNRVLVVGGIGPLGDLVTSCEIYNVSQDKWTTVASLNAGRYQHTATLLPQGTVLVTGGSGNSILPSCEFYSPTADTWRFIPELIKERRNHQVVLIGTSTLLAIGGSIGDEAVPTSLAQCETFSTPVNLTLVASVNEDASTAINLETLGVFRRPTFESYTQPTNGAITGTAPNLTYTPTADFNGTDSFTYKTKDQDFGTDTTTKVTLTVRPVNIAPSFTKGPDFTVAENADAQTSATWATTISAGPANEASQSLSFVVTTTNDGFFTAKPAIATDGTLTYTPGNNVNKTEVVTVSVSLKDSGGTANGGADTSAVQTFTITLTPVNSGLVVLNRNDSGADSLRDCLIRAHSGDTITFSENVFGSTNSDAATTINVLSELPPLDDGVVVLDASNRRVTINGSGAGSSSGLIIASAGNTVYGLSIVGFSRSAISLREAANNLVGGNRDLPLNPDANVPVRGPNGQGLRLAGNGAFGIEITGVGSTGNSVKGCWFGLDAAGTSAQPNLAGILIQDKANGNTIGSAVLSEANVISGNSFEGITVTDPSTDNNTIIGCLIGVAAVSSGPPAAAPAAGTRENTEELTLSGRGTVGNGSAGMFLSKGTQGTLAGADSAGSGNVLANNGSNGIEVRATASQKNSARRNRVLANKKKGIALFDNSNGGIVAPTIKIVTPTATGGAPVAGRATMNARVSGAATRDGTIEVFNDSGDQGGTFIGRGTCTGGQWEVDVVATAGMNVTATLTDADGNTSAFGVLGGNALTDTDGDGFPDDIETAVGTDPNSASSTPSGGGAAGTVIDLTVTKTALKLNFTAANKDTVSFSGTLPVDVLPVGKPTVLNFGGFTKSLIEKKEFKASKPKAGLTKYTVSVKAASLSAALADEGFDKTTGGSKSVKVVLLFNDKLYAKTLTLTYKVVPNKSGSAK